MNAQDLIALAETHLGKGSMVSSAQLCLDEARNAPNPIFARMWADKSLRYSIGCMHPEYIAARPIIEPGYIQETSD